MDMIKNDLHKISEDQEENPTTRCEANGFYNKMCALGSTQFSGMTY